MGTNLGNRIENLSRCCLEIQKNNIEILDYSSVYQTEPEGFTKQPLFLNMAIKVNVLISPVKLLNICKKIELKMGRKTGKKWRPRVIDIDILFFDHQNINKNNLKIPHPHLKKRKFALLPLLELSPDLKDPITREKYKYLLRKEWFLDVEKLGRLKTLIPGKE
ncbi:MAG: 2-amino-4-hydroxy-6-hydroxymethyldihydropteridine diphosphokinase [Actinomycetia bacterium]|nr:2-amino-4-hydroxy-6-hydroxymethyldihydropteridine diphosphokinase [Actinomycetes bacterium]